MWPPVTKDTPQGPLVTGALWMSILRGRSVYDGAFVSMDPADPRVGVPLDMHDAGSKYGAFDVTFSPISPLYLPYISPTSPQVRRLLRRHLQAVVDAVPGHLP